MWQQTYTPIGNSLLLSALVAAIPIFTLLILLGVMRKPSWIASLAGLAAAALVAAGVYGMPLGLLAGTVTYGAAFGLFPIGWVVFSAILLYRVTLESGKFEVLKDSIGHLTTDSRLQALLIAFAFEQAHVLFAGVMPHEAREQPAGGIVDYRNQVDLLAAPFQSVVRAGVPLHQFATTAPPRAPLMHLHHPNMAGSPRSRLGHQAS